MKKAITLLLVFCLVFGLVACGGGGGNEGSDSLRVGFGRVDVTPNYSVPLAGYGNTSQRMSQGFISKIYTTCIAITDVNDSTLLMITVDGTGMYNNIVPLLREAITKATGVTADRIMMNVTHVHSGVDMSNTSEASVNRYITEFVEKVAQVAADAMADRSPATMETAKGNSEDLSFIRHYTTTSGQLFSDNMSLNGEITGHHHEPDDEIQLIVFKREAEDKKDILAMNWQAHIKLDSTNETPEGQQGRPMISADGVGTCRDYVEENTDYLFAFYLGAAGNINTWSKIASENKTAKSKEFGPMLGEYVLEALKTTTPVEGTVIKATQRYYEATIDHTEDDKVVDAQKVNTVWKQTNSFSAAVDAAPYSGIISPYHASSIISRANNTEGTRKLEINAFTIGEIGLVTVPYEMFDTNALTVKDGSPFETTFVMSMCNGANSYVPAAYAYEGTGTYEVHNRLFIKGTAEGVADNLLEMLNELAG